MTRTPHRPIRVLHVFCSGKIGGIERLVCDLAARQAVGDQVIPSVLLSDGSGPFADAIRSLGINLITASSGTSTRTRVRDLPQVRRAASSSDIVHLHGFFPLIAVALLFERVPVLFHEHGVFGQGRRSTLRERLKRSLQGAFMRHCVAITVANSRFTAQRAGLLYRLNESQLKVVYNGITAEHFATNAPAPYSVARALGNPFTVGTVGRLVGLKRVDRLLRAVALTEATDVRALVVGDGPDRDSLVSLASRLGIQSQVEFVGSTVDVPNYLGQMDLFVLPSTDEPFGLVVVEALAANLPAVVFADAGGPLEILERLGCGGVVRDEAELAEVIVQGASGGQQPARCEMNRIKKEFGIDVMTEAFSTLYRLLAAGEDGAARL